MGKINEKSFRSSNELGKADLHVHSRYSRDAFSSLLAILKKAKEKQLDVIALTDHDTVKGVKEAQKMAPEFGVEVVMGEEISTKEGDLLALFIQKEIAPQRPVLDTIKEIKNQGGLSVIPHPNNWLLEGISTKVILKIFEQIDGIELFNGSLFGWIGRQENKKLNGATFNLAPTGGSDAHLSAQVGMAYTLFQGTTAKDLYFSIKNRLTLPGGDFWTWKKVFAWTANVSRIFYKYPYLPFKIAGRIGKKVLQ